MNPIQPTLLLASLALWLLAGTAPAAESAEGASAPANTVAETAEASGAAPEAATAGIDPDAIPAAPPSAVSETALQAIRPGPAAAVMPTAPAALGVPAADSSDVTVLQKVEIVGRKQVSYKNDVSFTGTKTATRLKDVPQSVSYVTKELMQDQLAVRSVDIIKNMSGINMFSGYEGDFSIRGFRTASTQLNGLTYNGDGWNQGAQWNLERYEVIKGPASALSGNAPPGGTVNLVTKKPLADKRQSASFTTGSFDTYRTHMDFTGPLNEQKSLLYRLNIGYENAASYRDLQLKKNFMVAPSVSFLPDDRTRINVDVAYIDLSGKLDRGQPIFGASAGTDLGSVPTSFAIGKPNDFLDERTIYATAAINHQLTPWLSLNASYLKSTFHEELQEHRTSNSYGVDSAGNQIANLMGMTAGYRINENVYDVATIYGVADFRLGPTGHQLLLSYDYGQQVVPAGSSAGQNASGYRNAANNGTISTYNPAQKSRYLLDAKGNPVPNVAHFNLTTPDYSIGNLNSYILTYSQTAPSKSFSNGVYLQDQIELGPVKALLGLRQEYYVNLLNYETSNEKWIEQFSLIPRLGLVYAINKDINLYGTYIQGFEPQSATQLADTARYGGPFDPLTSNMIEAGVKSEFFDRRLSATASVYQITQNNILVSANDAASPDRLRQRGQEQGRGVEMDVQGRINSSLGINVFGAYNKTEITKDANPELVGREKENAPNVMAGAWLRYNMIRGSFRGLGLGAGGNYVGERNTFSTALTLPSYAVYDAALYYNVNKVQLTFKVNNVFDEVHWTGGYDYNRLFPGAPRSVYSSVAYTF